MSLTMCLKSVLMCTLVACVGCDFHVIRRDAGAAPGTASKPSATARKHPYRGENYYYRITLVETNHDWYCQETMASIEDKSLITYMDRASMAIIKANDGWGGLCVITVPTNCPFWKVAEVSELALCYSRNSGPFVVGGCAPCHGPSEGGLMCALSALPLFRTKVTADMIKANAKECASSIGLENESARPRASVRVDILDDIKIERSKGAAGDRAALESLSDPFERATYVRIGSQVPISRFWEAYRALPEKDRFILIEKRCGNISICFTRDIRDLGKMTEVH